MGPIDNGSDLVQEMNAPVRRQAIIRTNADPVHRRIYAAQGGEELRSHLYTNV